MQSVKKRVRFNLKHPAILLAAGFSSFMAMSDVRAIEPREEINALKSCVFHRLSTQLKETFAQLLDRLNSLVVRQTDPPATARMTLAQRALILQELEKRTVLQFEPLNSAFFKTLEELSAKDAASSLRSVVERAPEQRTAPYELIDRAVKLNGIDLFSGRAHINEKYLEEWLKEGRWRMGSEFSGADSSLEPSVREILALSPDDQRFFLRKLLPVQAFNSIHTLHLVDFTPMKGRFRHFLWANGERLSGVGPAKEVTRSTFFSTITPVGHYGEDFAKSLQRTTQVMMDLVAGRLDAESAAVFNFDPDLVKLFTARGRQYKAAQAPSASLQEGVLTLHQAISLLLADKVNGADSGAQALKMLLNDPRHDLGPIAEFASHSPMGLIGPSIMRGVFFQNPVTLSQKGLNLSPEFRTYLLGQRSLRGKRVAQGKYVSDTATGCPFASRKATRSGSSENILKELGVAYWKLFEQLHFPKP